MIFRAQTIKLARLLAAALMIASPVSAAYAPGEAAAAAGAQPAKKSPARQKAISIGMTGDILLHAPLLYYRSYESAFAPVRKPLRSIDFLLGNLESNPGGKALGLHTYPRFNSSASIVRAMRQSGYDMAVNANNHILDFGYRGMSAGIRNLRAYGMPYVGAGLDEKDRRTPRIVTVKGVRLGVLAYTYGTNGYRLPPGRKGLVPYLEPARMKADIARLRKRCDLVVLSLHWGTEYSLKVNSRQRALAKSMAAAGADIIFGHHPHVVQPFEIVKAPNGRKAYTFYSLGNFYSGMRFAHTDYGILGVVRVRKAPGKRPAIFSASAYPVVNAFSAKRKKVVYPFDARPNIAKAKKRALLKRIHLKEYRP